MKVRFVQLVLPCAQSLCVPNDFVPFGVHGILENFRMEEACVCEEAVVLCCMLVSSVDRLSTYIFVACVATSVACVSCQQTRAS